MPNASRTHGAGTLTNYHSHCHGNDWDLVYETVDAFSGFEFAITLSLSLSVSLSLSLSLYSLFVGCAARVLGLHDVRELWGSGEGLDPQLLE